jgi:L-aminopeptidase/D-esterase-like protein
VLLTGGSAFGLGAADGVARWLEAQALGRPTPGGVVPLVPAAVVFDLVEGQAGVRPGPEDGYAACENSVTGPPARGAVGAGTGAAVGKLLGRERASRGGIGYSAALLPDGKALAAIAVANAFGDVVEEDGTLLGSPRDDQGALVRSADLIGQMPGPPDISSLSARAAGNTTLVCVYTDADLDKRGCAILARMASAGIARAVNPAFTPLDGDVVFAIASGTEPALEPGLGATWALTAMGTIAANTTAAAIRDAVRQARRSATTRRTRNSRTAAT